MRKAKMTSFSRVIFFFFLVIASSLSAQCNWNSTVCPGSTREYNVAKCWTCDGTNSRIPNATDNVNFPSSNTPLTITISPTPKPIAASTFVIGSLVTVQVKEKTELEVNVNITVNSKGTLTVFGRIASFSVVQSLLQIEKDGQLNLMNNAKVENMHLRLEGKGVFEGDFYLGFGTKSEIFGSLDWKSFSNSPLPLPSMSAFIAGSFVLAQKSVLNIFGGERISINSTDENANFMNGGIIRINASSSSSLPLRSSSSLFVPPTVFPTFTFQIKFTGMKGGMINLLNSLTLKFLQDSDFNQRIFLNFAAPGSVVFASYRNSSVTHRFLNGITLWDEKERPSSNQLSHVYFGTPSSPSPLFDASFTGFSSIYVMDNSTLSANLFYLSSQAKINVDASCDLKVRSNGKVELLGTIEGIASVKRKGRSLANFKSSSRNLLPLTLSGALNGTLDVTFDTTLLTLEEPKIDAGIFWVNTQLNLTSAAGSKGSGTIQIGNNSKMVVEAGDSLDFGGLTLSFALNSHVTINMKAENPNATPVKAAKFSFVKGTSVDFILQGIPQIGAFYKAFEATSGSNGFDGLPKYSFSSPWKCGIEYEAKQSGSSSGILMDKVKTPTPPSALQIVNQPQFTTNTLVWIPSVVGCNATVEYYNITIKYGNGVQPNSIKYFNTTKSYLPINDILPPCTFAELSVQAIVSWKGDSKVVVKSNGSPPYPSFILPVGSKPAQPIVSSLSDRSAFVTWKNTTSLGDACNATIASVEIRVTMKEKPTPETVNLPSSQSSYEFPNLMACTPYKFQIAYWLLTPHTNTLSKTQSSDSVNGQTIGATVNPPSPRPIETDTDGNSFNARLNMNKPSVCLCNGIPIYQGELFNGKDSYFAETSSKPESVAGASIFFSQLPIGTQYISRSRLLCMFEDGNSTSPWSEWSESVDPSPFWKKYMWMIIVTTASVIGAIIIVLFVSFYIHKKRQMDRRKSSSRFHRPSNKGYSRIGI